MSTSAAAGHDVVLNYLYEDNGFASSPSDSTDKTFGADATLSTFEGANNAVRVFNPNSREASNIIEQQFAGSWSVDFTLTNPWWTAALVDEKSTSGASAPYTHDFSGTTPVPLQLTYYDASNDFERVLKGCVVSSATISADVGGEVSVSLDGAYADETLTDAPGTTPTQVTTSYRPLTFSEATIERPSGTTLNLVQSASVTIQNNTDLIYELGSRTAVDYSPKTRAITVDYTDIINSKDDTARMYGDSAATSPEAKVDNSMTIDFVMDNGETGAAKNTYTVAMTTVLPDSYDVSGAGSPEDDLEGALSEMAAGVSVTAENGDENP